MKRTLGDRLIGPVIHLAGITSLFRFSRALSQPRQTQERLLRRILHDCAESAFGKHFRFSAIRTVRDFQQAVPLQTYETLSPYMDRVHSGESAALLPPREKILMFGMTSGSSGDPKRIPVTTRYLRRFRKTYRLWSSLALRDHPLAVSADFCALFSSWRERFTSQGVPCGAVTGLVAELQLPWIKKRMAIPLAFSSIEDPEVREATALHHALAHNVSFFTAANPSTLLRIPKRLEREFESLLRELADGTFRYLGALPEEYRRHPDFRKNPDRARKVGKRIENEGAVLPLAVWPELALISCWTGGTLTPYLEPLRRYFPGVPIRDPGLIASEGRFTIPVADDTATGVPDLTGIFFEFHPAEDGGEVPIGEPVALMLPHELEVGKRYYMVFTTSWGLYRYHIDDIVEVTERRGEVPLFQFIRKGSGYASITGEKLSEDQVILAIEALPARFLEQHGDCVVTPLWGDPPGYLLVLEDDSDSPDAELGAMALKVDESLRGLNLEYDSKRKSHRLAPIRAALVGPRTFDRLKRREVERAGGRSEQYKLKRIRGDFEFIDSLGEYRVVEPDQEGVAPLRRLSKSRQ